MSKRYKALINLVENKEYELEKALELAKKTATAKFAESVELAIKLNVDPKKSEQIVRGAVLFPHGIGRKVKIIVFAKGEKEKEAKEAGADEVGFTDLIDKITKGWLDFDVAIATPDVMKDISKLGKVLGTKGLFPNPKTGTVTFDVGKAVREFKKGKLEYKTDAGGVIHSIIGKASFSVEQLTENANTLIDAVLKVKPTGIKGEYVESVSVCSTMGPGIKLNHKTLVNKDAKA